MQNGGNITVHLTTKVAQTKGLNIFLNSKLVEEYETVCRHFILFITLTIELANSLRILSPDALTVFQMSCSAARVSKYHLTKQLVLLYLKC